MKINKYQFIKSFYFAVLLAGALFSGILTQSSAHHYTGTAAIVQLDSEPPAILVVDAPIPSELAMGKVIIQYHTENLRILPVYGAAALKVSPRTGHIHITVDSLPWHWADASNEPIIIVGLGPGLHNILIELADPTHHVMLGKKISFVVPVVKQPHMDHK